EQYADHGKIDPRPRHAPGIAARQRGGQLASAIDAARLEMPPAAVIRNAQVRIARTGHRLDFGCRVVEPRALDAEVARAARRDRIENVPAALADRRRLEERCDDLRTHRLRPRVTASCSAVGTGSLLK